MNSKLERTDNLKSRPLWKQANLNNYYRNLVVGSAEREASLYRL